MKNVFTKCFDAVLKGLIYCLVHLFFRPKLEFVDPSQKEKILSEPSILVSNHIWHLDGMVIGSKFFSKKICHMAAKDRFADKKQAFFFRHMNCIPIDRQQLDTSWLYQALDKLKKQQEHIAIYPEGRHGHDGEILPFHSGITTIAALAQVPLVMIYIDGPYNWLIGRRIRLLVSSPFYLDAPTNGMNADYISEQTEKLHTKMLELQAKMWEKYPERRKVKTNN